MNKNTNIPHIRNTVSLGSNHADSDMIVFFCKLCVFSRDVDWIYWSEELAEPQVKMVLYFQ